MVSKTGVTWKSFAVVDTWHNASMYMIPSPEIMNRHTMVILMLEYTPYGYRLAVKYVYNYVCI